MIRLTICLIVALHNGLASGQFVDSLNSAEAISVISIDSAFDGGSLLIESKANFRGSEKQAYLLILNPSSKIIVRHNQQIELPVFLSMKKKPSVENLKPVSKEALKQIISLMFRVKGSNPKLHANVVSLLMALSIGEKIQRWGAEAVDALEEEGQWMKIFTSKA